jgi:hypothetical protein
MWDNAGEIDLPAPHLARANRNLAQSIEAALALGDMDLLMPDMEWVEGLIHNYNFEVENGALHHFIDLYREAASEQLNGEGKIIVDWLQNVATE